MSASSALAPIGTELDEVVVEVDANPAAHGDGPTVVGGQRLLDNFTEGSRSDDVPLVALLDPVLEHRRGAQKGSTNDLKS